MQEFDPIKYKNEYSKQNYDRITIVIPKGKKDQLKAAASLAGKSMNEFIIAALEAYTDIKI